LGPDDDTVHLVGPFIHSRLVGVDRILVCENSSVVIRLVSFLWFGIARIWEAVPVFERDFDPSESTISHKLRNPER
jgi:hypothetical protein